MFSIDWLIDPYLIALNFEIPRRKKGQIAKSCKNNTARFPQEHFSSKTALIEYPLDYP